MIVYEVSVGKRPFRSKTNEGLTDAILHEELSFPPPSEKQLNPKIKDLTEKFIVRDINKRLGCAGTGGFANLMKHAAFSEYNWQEIQDKKVVPTFIPDVICFNVV